jgi:type IV secretion system protein VirD4
MANLPTTLPGPRNLTRNGANDGLLLGRKVSEDGSVTADKVIYEGPLHTVLFGPNGVGKGMRFLVPNLLNIEGKSIVVIDPKGQLAAMTAKWRHENGDDVKIIDPFGVLEEVVRERPDTYRYLIEHGLYESVGFNPLAILDPEGPTFFDDAAVIADALIKIQGNEPHWTESAQGLLTGLLMWERQQKGSDATLEHVRYMLTEADKYEDLEDEAGNLVKTLTAGLRVTASDMVANGGFEIASLAARFAAKNTTDEIESVRSTADTQTRWLLSQPMRRDLQKNGVDFSKLKSGDRPMTVYVILPANYLETHSVWLRLVVSEALRASMTVGGRTVLMMLDEFAALGHLSIVQKLFGVTRDYKVQMWPVFQDLPQLKHLYPERWETLLGMAGVVQSFRAGDLTTADWISKRSGTGTAVAMAYSENAGNSNSSTGMNRTQIALPRISSDFTFGLPDEFTIAYFAGLNKPSIVYAPHLDQLPRLHARALPNPYYRPNG